MWYLNDYNAQHQHDSVLEIENIFTDEEIEHIKNYDKIYNERKGTTGDTPSPDVQDLSVRNSSVVWVPPNEQTEWLYRRITDVLIKVNTENYRYNLTGFGDIQLTKYYGSDESPNHYSGHSDTSSIVNQENNIRKLSMSIVISDPSEYEGGELIMFKDNIKGNYYKPKKGSAITFPSQMVHEVTPVTKGLRYSLVVWVLGPRWS